jgi:hypothetical protein
VPGRASRHVHAHAVSELRPIAHDAGPMRRLCLGCGLRRARFRHRGVVKADADHTLCFRCFRALNERVRAARLVTGLWLPALGSRSHERTI